LTTGSPRTATATLAPISPRSAKFAANASRTGSNPAAHVPLISKLVSLIAPTSAAQGT
jgi:hypothetical protein